MYRSAIIVSILATLAFGASAQNGPPDFAGGPGNGGPGNGGNNGNGPGNSGNSPGNSGNAPGRNRGGNSSASGSVVGFDTSFAPPGLSTAPGLNRGSGAPGQCSADRPDSAVPGQSGRSHTAHTNFAGIDPDTGDLLDGEDDPWARMTYFWVGERFDYVFNAHNLEPGDEHTLVAEVTNEDESLSYLCVGDGEVNDEGDLHIADSVELEQSLGYDAEVEGEQEGVPFVLVDSADVDCESGELSGDASGDYLYSILNIVFVDTGEEDDG